MEYFCNFLEQIFLSHSKQIMHVTSSTDIIQVSFCSAQKKFSLEV